MDSWLYGGYWYVTNMEMLCYFGGIDRSAVRYNLSGFIHHEMYKHALELGLERYNYGGISGYFEKGQDGYGSLLFQTRTRCDRCSYVRHFRQTASTRWAKSSNSA